jgi:hypothetical protein
MKRNRKLCEIWKGSGHMIEEKTREHCGIWQNKIIDS